MKIVIQSIPHLQQRYNTVGDWIQSQVTGDITILVSEELGEIGMKAVILHELTEALLCDHNDITSEDVDEFDKDCDPLDEVEPGDKLHCPYQQEHGFAMAVERIFTSAAELTWEQHERCILNLTEQYEDEKGQAT